MASSSSPACKPLKICSYSSGTVLQKEEITEKDWLQLGLGSSGINKCKKTQQAACFGAYNGNNSGLEMGDNRLKLGLGTGLGLINGDHNCGVEIVEAPSHSSSKAYNGTLEVGEKGLQLGLGIGLGLIDCDYNHGVEIMEEAPHSSDKAYNGNNSGLEVGEKGLQLIDGDHTCGVEIMEAPPHSSNYYYNYSDGGQEIHNHHVPVQEVRNHENSQCGPIRVVPQPSSRAGLWFALSSSTNGKGKALPQIPLPYIRVKDENMTVLMVKRYLVTKLGLSNEAEIDIRCMGHNISHLQTLKQVRDTVWLPELIVNSSTPLMPSQKSNCNNTVNYVMPLHYTRRSVFD